MKIKIGASTIILLLTFLFTSCNSWNPQNPNDDSTLWGQSCHPGQFVTGVDARGQLICAMPTYINIQDGTGCNDNNLCTTGDVYTNGVCGGNELVCQDNNSCTMDSCNPNSGCSFEKAPDGTLCEGGACALGSCVVAEPTCSDSILNGNETDTDCGGGSCVSCNIDGKCRQGSDCSSRVCRNNICQAPNCSDGVLNGSETDLDCGGPICGSCSTAQKCLQQIDCSSYVCRNNICQAPTCRDGVKNGTETGIDCGGICATCTINN